VGRRKGVRALDDIADAGGPVAREDVLESEVGHDGARGCNEERGRNEQASAKGEEQGDHNGVDDHGRH